MSHHVEKMKKLSMKAESNMPRHERCMICVCQGIKGACWGMQAEEKSVESSMSWHESGKSKKKEFVFK